MKPSATSARPSAPSARLAAIARAPSASSNRVRGTVLERPVVPEVRRYSAGGEPARAPARAARAAGAGAAPDEAGSRHARGPTVSTRGATRTTGTPSSAPTASSSGPAVASRSIASHRSAASARRTSSAGALGSSGNAAHACTHWRSATARSAPLRMTTATRALGGAPAANSRRRASSTANGSGARAVAPSPSKRKSAGSARRGISSVRSSGTLDSSVCAMVGVIAGATRALDSTHGEHEHKALAGQFHAARALLR